MAKIPGGSSLGLLRLYGEKRRKCAMVNREKQTHDRTNDLHGRLVVKSFGFVFLLLLFCV
jgi:hypothetical protein